jgi:hypothetical protein
MEEYTPNQKPVESESKEEHRPDILTPAKVEPLKISPEFSSVLGGETTQKMLRENYISRVFDNTISDAKKRYPDKKLGIRSILSAQKEGLTITTEDNATFEVSTIDQISDKGGETNSLNTRVTMADRGEEDLEMSKRYLQFAIRGVEKNNLTDSVNPSILVYDTSKASEGTTDSEISFPSLETKKDSLLAIYEIDSKSVPGISHESNVE